MVFYDKDNIPEDIFLKIEARVKKPKFKVTKFYFNSPPAKELFCVLHHICPWKSCHTEGLIKMRLGK